MSTLFRLNCLLATDCSHTCSFRCADVHSLNADLDRQEGLEELAHAFIHSELTGALDDFLYCCEKLDHVCRWSGVLSTDEEIKVCCIINLCL